MAVDPLFIIFIVIVATMSSLALPSVCPVPPRLFQKVVTPPQMHPLASGPQGDTVPEILESFPTVQTEVWSWGAGKQGQLGHGDYLDR